MDETLLHFRRRIRDEFHRLFDQTPGARDESLDALAHTDPELATTLRRLLSQADEQREADAIETRDIAGTIVADRFKLIRLLGAGGMGEVFLAERLDEVSQRVALKLVRTDLPIPLARALRERQILALMNHPHIAGLVDAGRDASGRPWFAMEYVDGEPITRRCDRTRASIDERVRLFVLICRAVQFAHRNLVLHRDLKPSNIFIDREGVPKLLDFGIAKLLDADDPRETQTFALTPAYAAPEQLRGESATTASDVYQLGLVLYELLGGVSAHSVRGESGAPLRMAHAFANARQKRTLDGIAELRGTSDDKLTRILKGDLGRIVAKATAMEPQERYETALAFADDLERWLGRLPVSAHRGTFAYRARRFVQRHAAATALVAFCALGLVATSIVALNRAHREREQREAAELERARAETLLDFMKNIFEQAEPANAKGIALTAPALLDRAAAELSRRADLDLVTKAILTKQVADTFLWVGEPEKSRTFAEQALAALEPVRTQQQAEYFSSVHSVMSAQYVTGDFRGLVELGDRVLSELGDAHADPSLQAQILRDRGTAYCRLGEAEACETDLRAAIDRYQAMDGELPRDFAQTINNLASLVDARGNALEAYQLFDRALAINAKSSDPVEVPTLILTYNRAKEMFQIGRVDEAIADVEPLPDRFAVLAGPDRVYGAMGMRRLLARAYAVRGEATRAVETIDSLLSAGGKAAAYPGLSDDMAANRVAKASIALALDDLATADASARTVADSGQEQQAFGHEIVRAEWLVGEIALHRGDCVHAQAYFDRAETGARKLSGTRPSWLLAEIEDSRGRCAMLSGDAPTARNHFAKAVREYENSLGADAASTTRSRIHVVWALSSEPSAERARQIATLRSALAAKLGEHSSAVTDCDALVDALESGEAREPVSGIRSVL